MTTDNSEVIDRLTRERDEARAELQEQSRLLGMSAEREADLLAEVERLRECDEEYWKLVDRCMTLEADAERWKYARYRLSPAECVNHGWPSLGDLPAEESIESRLDRMADIGIDAAREGK